MFERFTDGSRRVLVLAQEEARALRDEHIGTEHLLLALLREDAGVAATVLTPRGITADAVRQQLGSRIEPAAHSAVGHIAFTPRAKKAMEQALREALHIGDEHIGTEHILLALVRDEDATAAQVLKAVGTALRDVRDEIMATMRERGEGRALEAPSGAATFARQPASALAVQMLGDQPRCSRCNNPTAESLRARSARVPEDADGDREHAVVLLWCSRCGGVIGVIADTTEA